VHREPLPGVDPPPTRPCVRKCLYLRHFRASLKNATKYSLLLKGISRPSQVAAWIVENRVKALNVAGNRESKAPGIGARVEAFLGRVFRRLASGV
jgi:hypothetical protein